MNERASVLRDLACMVPGARLFGEGHQAVTGIAYDSRMVQRGDLFAALKGADFDGHHYVAEAERRGAAALLVEEHNPSALPQIVVHDTRFALSPVSAQFYGRPSQTMGTIGITGTDGKTTTSFIVDHVLRFLGAATGLIGTVAIRIGEREEFHASRQTTPESSDVQRYLRQMADAHVDWAILEATSHGLAMFRLDDVRFRIGAVTNITHEHLDFHGSVENYRRAKAKLLERVGRDAGIVVTNADDPGARLIEAFAGEASFLRYSIHDRNADVAAVNVRRGVRGSAFELMTGGQHVALVDFPLIGEFNVANALCAASIAVAAGFDIESVARALETTPPVPGRMARIDLGQPFSVVVDYAHTPESMAKVLQLLRELHSDGRLIVVFGSAGERDTEKRSLQGAVAARLADISVISSEDPRNEDAEGIISQIAAGARAAGAIDGSTLFSRTDRREAIRVALALARPGDCLLLAGKGHEASIIWGRVKLPWDEADVARELLAELGYSAETLRANDSNRPIPLLRAKDERVCRPRPRAPRRRAGRGRRRLEP